MARQPVDIPDELLDEIMSYLHPDVGESKEDLSACTLVSRAWYPVAQSHLFRHIYLTIRAGTLSLDEHFNTAMTLRSLITLDLFVNFLRDHPPLGFYIRQLSLYLNIPTHPENSSWKINADLFVSLLKLTPNVQKLFLSEVALALPAGFVYPASRPSLSHLEVSCSGARPSPPDFILLSLCFEHIDKLSWRCLRASHPAEALYDAPLPLPSLVHHLTLDLTDFQPAELDDALSRAVGFDTLRTLRLVPADDVGVYRGTLEKARAQLRRLEICLPADVGVSLVDLVPSILSCSKLEGLLVETDLSLSDVGMLSEQVEALSDLLLHVNITVERYPAMKELVLVLHIDIFEYYDVHGLPKPEKLTEGLDQMLVDITRLSPVREIGCRWHELYNPQLDDIEGWLRKLFPLLNKKNLLRLERVEGLGSSSYITEGA